MTFSILLARLAGLVVGCGTFVFLFLGHGWEWSNAFLVPDLLLGVLLVLGSALPWRLGLQVLAGGFAFAAGVFSVATMEQVLEGQLGVGLAVSLATSVVMAAYLLGQLRRRAAEPGSATRDD